MRNQAKSILSKLAIASNNNKSTVVIKQKKNISNLLIFLWKEGYILGYTLKNKGYYIIYLKPIFVKNIALKNKFYKNNYISHKDSKNLFFLQKNSSFLIKTQLGFTSIQVCKKRGLGGELISKF